LIPAGKLLVALGFIPMLRIDNRDIIAICTYTKRNNASSTMERNARRSLYTRGVIDLGVKCESYSFYDKAK
jgi:hypothetical protein